MGRRLGRGCSQNSIAKGKGDTRKNAIKPEYRKEYNCTHHGTSMGEGRSHGFTGGEKENCYGV